MMRLDFQDVDHRAGEDAPRPNWWPLILAFIVATLLLLVRVSFDGFDRLLPEGEPFLPYFTT